MLKNELRKELLVKGVELTDGEFKKFKKVELETMLKDTQPKKVFLDIPEVNYSELIKSISEKLNIVTENDNKNTEKVISVVNDLESTIENIADKYTKELIRRISFQNFIPKTKENKYVCKVLGKTNTPYGTRNIYGKCECCGKGILEPGVVKYSKIHFGKPVCRSCQKKSLEQKAMKNFVANNK